MKHAFFLGNVLGKALKWTLKILKKCLGLTLKKVYNIKWFVQSSKMTYFTVCMECDKVYNRIERLLW